jgi:hypothetical protein
MSWFIAGLARLVLIGVWIFTPYVARAFDGGVWGWLLPLLGVLFLPITALSYILVNELAGGVTGWAWAWIVVAFLIDLSAHSFAARSTQRRTARYGSV